MPRRSVPHWAAGQLITFRLYAYDTKVDNVIVNGTVAVPEPSAVALSVFGLGEIMLTLVRRRSRQA